jgi:hypothetical protein
VNTGRRQCCPRLVDAYPVYKFKAELRIILKF